MKKIQRLDRQIKILLTIPIIAGLVIATVLLTTQNSEGEDALSRAVEGGQLALTSIGRNHESLEKLAQNNETQARELLDAARAALENAKAKLNSATQTDDEYMLGMLDNYQGLVNASDVMAQGLGNLLLINANLTNALDYYYDKDYGNASEQAAYCLQILTPLLKDFEKSNSTLDAMNLFYIPSGQRDELTLRVGQYRNEMQVYNQTVLLLQSLQEGKESLQANDLIEEYMRQMQNAISNGDYDKAEQLRQKINEVLQSLKNPESQKAAGTASQLDPSLLNGTSSDVAQELKEKLKNQNGIDGYENYLKSLQKYLDALKSYEQGDKQGAQDDLNEGLQILGPGERGDPNLQGLREGLIEAFNTLQLRMGQQPPPG